MLLNMTKLEKLFLLLDRAIKPKDLTAFDELLLARCNSQNEFERAHKKKHYGSEFFISFWQHPVTSSWYFDIFGLILHIFYNFFMRVS